MLLITEALLLILAALGQDHRDAVEGQIFPLDMALNSVDDQYEGCREKMTHLVETEYLNKEISNLPDCKKTWQDGERYARTPEDNLTRNNLIAIYVYTNSDINVYRDFNNAVRNGKQKYDDKTFTWYSLQFLLTEAIQILNKTQKKCYSTYRGTNVTFNKHVLNKEVRFGSFTSSSLDRTVAEGFGSKSCFEIYTCEGADLKKYSKFPNEQEVLIPPYEKFKVTAVKTRRDEPDLWCDTVFTLKSSGTRSDLNCALFKKPTKTLKNTSK
ncbi:NAD(P)(+)--arginine ADP-ribosyltransferase 1-like, partial [Sinocyclocheilus grahami]|uniref:NAD(P)(+)--arginine ADP-ribosyltransferase 1-like n=1 Tax=Sinocyclocheilus grahami TaxID=75366 RepID=UPI0007AC6004